MQLIADVLEYTFYVALILAVLAVMWNSQPAAGSTPPPPSVGVHPILLRT